MGVYRWSLFRKIGLAFGILTALMVVLGIYVVWQQFSGLSDLERLNAAHEAYAQTVFMEDAFYGYDDQMNMLVLAAEHARSLIAPTYRMAQQDRQEFWTAWRWLYDRRSTLTPQERGLLDGLGGAMRAYDRAEEAVLSDVHRGATASAFAMQVYGNVSPSNALMAGLSQLRKQLQADSQAARTDQLAGVVWTRDLTVAGTVLATAVAVLVTVWAAGYFSRPFLWISAELAKVGEGDLRAEYADEAATDEAGAAKQALVRAVRRMREAVRVVRDEVMQLAKTADVLGEQSSQSQAAARQIATAGEQVGRAAARTAASVQSLQERIQSLSESARQVSLGATRQAEFTGRLKEAAGTLSQTADQVSQGAAGVREASDAVSGSAQTGRGLVTELGGVVQSMSGALERAAREVETLSRTAEEIDSVLDVIRRVTAQTNLLAVNAAIEAARAGEQGRGFAVVASEVKKLAENTAASTGDIRRIVEGIRESVDSVVQRMTEASQEGRRGTEAVRRVLEAFEQLEKVLARMEGTARDMERASSALEEIRGPLAAAVEELSASAEENAAVAQQMGELADAARRDVGEVAAMAEETSAAAEEMAAASAQAGSAADRAEGALDLARQALQRVLQAQAVFRIGGEGA